MAQDDLKEEIRYLEKKVRRYQNRLCKVRAERDEWERLFELCTGKVVCDIHKKPKG